MENVEYSRWVIPRIMVSNCTQRIGILSLGIGNVKAVHGALRRLGKGALEVSTPNDLKGVTHLIIPGVGAMPAMMRRIKEAKLLEELRIFSRYEKILGICLGFHTVFI